MPSPQKLQMTVKIRVRQEHGLADVAWFVGRRLGFGILVLLSIILLSYLGLEMARGTGFWPAVEHALRNTALYLGRLFQGNLGMSSSGSVTRVPVPVARVVAETLPRTLGLLATSLGLSALIGTLLGVLAATRKSERGSVFVTLATAAGMSVPSFFAALILQLIVLAIFRSFGLLVLPIWGFGWDTHIILPAMVIATRPIAQTARITYVKMRDVLQQDYVRTAYSKGLGSWHVIFRHAVRNAAIPILTTLTVSLRFSLSSLPLVEYFFGWPGVGLALLKSISQQDDNTTIALLLFLGMLVILVNLLIELAYRLIDPRLQDERPARFVRTAPTTLHQRLLASWNRLQNGAIPLPVVNLRSIACTLRQALINDPLMRWIREKRWLEQCKKIKCLVPSKHCSRIEIFPPHSRQLVSHSKPIATAQGKAHKRFQKMPHRYLLSIGGIILVALLIIVIFGPRLTPHSPYTTRGLERVDGEYRVPPYAPSKVYLLGSDPLGRDILSLILAGAQQTLVLAVFVVAARLLVGFLLGIVSGWFNGTWLDRFLLSTAELISAFPALLLAMILILAIGIRQGFQPFVIALCFIGWGEIMQFVRSEVLTLRSKPFIASAHAIAASTRRIVLTHMVPHMIPALIPLIALEMGGVFMLLGELGFLGIFIGGGAFAELSMVAPPYHYSDVPEWGALLSNVRTYARSYPWVAIYPSLAFFLSALGFNLFGEGLRILVDKGRLQVKWLFNRYSVVLVVAVVGLLFFVNVNTGSMAYYRQFSQSFSGQRAYAVASQLSDPSFEGRALGSAGMDKAAEYIAEQFEFLGLQAAGEEYTYYDTRLRSHTILDAVPRLQIEGDQTTLTYKQDYVEYAGTKRNSGNIQGEITFIIAGELSLNRYGEIAALKDMEVADQVLVFLTERDAAAFDFNAISIGGMLVIAEEQADLSRGSTLPTGGPNINLLSGRPLERQEYPKLWISKDVAEDLLAGTGKRLDELYHEAESLPQGDIVEFHTNLSASIQVQDTVYLETEARHVLAYWPGTMGGEALGRRGLAMDNRVVMVIAKYDTPPLSPDGAFYPGANDNASGVAVMLEAIRTLKESGYEPYRTLLFVAYSGEGYEGGHSALSPEGSEFLKAARGFSSFYEIEAVVRLRGLGAGDGRGLALSGGGNMRLMNLFEDAANRLGVYARPVNELLDVSIIIQDKSFWEGGQEAPNIGLSWEGWNHTAGTITDTSAALSIEKLEQAGRSLALGLMILGREREY